MQIVDLYGALREKTLSGQLYSLLLVFARWQHRFVAGDVNTHRH